MIGLPRESLLECVLVVAHWVGHGKDDTVKECLKKRGLDIRQARKMGQDRSELRVFVRGSA